GFEEGAVHFDNLTGSASITNSTLGDAAGTSFAADLFVHNTTGTLNRLTVDTVIFGKVGSTGTNALDFAVNGAAGITANITVTNSTVTNYLGSGLQAVSNQNSAMDVVFRNNTVSNNNINAAPGSNGIKISGDAAGFGDNVTFDVSHNAV